MTALYQLAAAGLFCACLLSLGGRDGQKEILRFACACLMVVLLLNLLGKTSLPAGDLARFEGQVQGAVDDALRENREALLEQTALALGQEVERQAAALSLDCAAELACTADGEGRVTVHSVTILYRSGPREALETLRQTIAAQLALSEGQITIQEEPHP